MQKTSIQWQEIFFLRVKGGLESKEGKRKIKYRDTKSVKYRLQSLFIFRMYFYADIANAVQTFM